MMFLYLSFFNLIEIKNIEPFIPKAKKLKIQKRSDLVITTKSPLNKSILLKVKLLTPKKPHPDRSICKYQSLDHIPVYPHTQGEDQDRFRMLCLILYLDIQYHRFPCLQ